LRPGLAIGAAGQITTVHEAAGFRRPRLVWLLDPETLPRNRTDRIVTDGTLLAPIEALGKVPATELLVSITEVLFHCGKALIRSKLWDPSRQVSRDSFPPGRIVPVQTAVMSVEAAKQFVVMSYGEKL
jgi:hypothetical protein